MILGGFALMASSLEFQPVPFLWKVMIFFPFLYNWSLDWFIIIQKSFSFVGSAHWFLPFTGSPVKRAPNCHHYSSPPGPWCSGWGDWHFFICSLQVQVSRTQCHHWQGRPRLQQGIDDLSDSLSSLAEVVLQTAQDLIYSFYSREGCVQLLGKNVAFM